MVQRHKSEFKYDEESMSLRPLNLHQEPRMGAINFSEDIKFLGGKYWFSVEKNESFFR
jgi:hypothetical protein